MEKYQGLTYPKIMLSLGILFEVVYSLSTSEREWKIPLADLFVLLEGIAPFIMGLIAVKIANHQLSWFSRIAATIFIVLPFILVGSAERGMGKGLAILLAWAIQLGIGLIWIFTAAVVRLRYQNK